MPDSTAVSGGVASTRLTRPPDLDARRAAGVRLAQEAIDRHGPGAECVLRELVAMLDLTGRADDHGRVYADPVPETVAAGPPPDRVAEIREPIRHGTPDGYRRHVDRDEPPCGPCRIAGARTAAEIRALQQAPVPARFAEPPAPLAPVEPDVAPAPRKPRKPRPVRRTGADRIDPVTRDVCGTVPGVSRHREHGERMCGPCAAARNTYQRQWRSMHRPQGSRTPAVCGTTSGYHAHRRQGESPCLDCRAANSAYHRIYRQERRSQ